MVGRIVSAAALGVLGATAYGIAGRSAEIFGPSICRGIGTRRTISLTFDDGPSEGTLNLLEILAKHGVRATFFECGANVARHGEIALAALRQGHELANHTYSHPRLYPNLVERPYIKTSAFIDREFSEAQRVIEAETGATPRLLRAPYGLRWYGMRAVQQKLGLLGVMWTVIGHDWEWPASRIAGRVLQKAAPGGIICLHDGRNLQSHPDISETLAAVNLIVPALKQEGYGFETVSEMITNDGRSHRLLNPDPKK